MGLESGADNGAIERQQRLCQAVTYLQGASNVHADVVAFPFAYGVFQDSTLKLIKALQIS